MLNSLLIVIFINYICIEFIMCSVSFIVYVVLYVVFCLNAVLFVCCVLLQYHCHGVKAHLQLN
jgi:hypothetical protein